MVAYSFKAQFGEPIVSRIKRHTVRANRKRHARPGEALQLYVGMRTRHCHKLLTPDPICTSVRAITIALSRQNWLIDRVEIEGERLTHDEIEAFAIADGFGGEFGSAALRMGQFWRDNHGLDPFEGVVINWEDQ